jgi:hypothetical protein
LGIPFQPGVYYHLLIPSDIDIPNLEALLDTDYSLLPGRDYCIYDCLGPDNQSTSFKVSLNTTAPEGYTTENSRKIGGFPTLCVAAGSGRTYYRGGVQVDHDLNGWLAAEILPLGFWDLKHRPEQTRTPQPGLVYEKYLGFWPMIYGQSGTGLNTISAYQGTLSRSREYVDLLEDLVCNGLILLSDEEFAAAALGSPEMVAVMGASEAAATNGGAGGRIATNNQRILSYCGCEEMVGTLWWYLRTTAAAGMAGAIYGRTGGTDASPTYGTLTMTTSAHGPYPQAGSKGQFWGLAGALLAGGDWNCSSSCGSRARNANNARSHAHSYYGGRGRARGAA